jgi:hypothetical protein
LEEDFEYFKPYEVVGSGIRKGIGGKYSKRELGEAVQNQRNYY